LRDKLGDKKEGRRRKKNSQEGRDKSKLIAGFEKEIPLQKEKNQPELLPHFPKYPKILQR
jgi:hypothetical protein